MLSSANTGCRSAHVKRSVVIPIINHCLNLILIHNPSEKIRNDKSRNGPGGNRTRVRKSIHLASPITASLYSFPLPCAGWQAQGFSSFIRSFFSAKLRRKRSPSWMMPFLQAREPVSRTAAFRRQRARTNYRLRLILGLRLLTRSQEPRMASQTSKSPSKPVLARIRYIIPCFMKTDYACTRVLNSRSASRRMSFFAISCRLS